MPAALLPLLACANSKGVKLLAYVYPCLAFEPLKEYWVAGRSSYVLSSPLLSSPFLFSQRVLGRRAVIVRGAAGWLGLGSRGQAAAQC